MISWGNNMKTRNKLFASFGFVLLLALVTSLWPAIAQDVPYYPSTLTLHISSAPTEPPTVDVLTDGSNLFRINPVGSVTGDLEGSFAQRITQVDSCSNCDPAVNQLIPITAFFTIETGEGSIEGYYSGAFYSTEESFPDQLVKAHGQILSVTAAYADLYLADVYYDGVVDFEEIDGSLVPLGDRGPMVISRTNQYFSHTGA